MVSGQPGQGSGAASRFAPRAMVAREMTPDGIGWRGAHALGWSTILPCPRVSVGACAGASPHRPDRSRRGAGRRIRTTRGLVRWPRWRRRVWTMRAGAAYSRPHDKPRGGPAARFDHDARRNRRPSNQESSMRRYLDIDLNNRTITSRELHGEEIVRAGRYLIAKTLLELGAATVDPLSPARIRSSSPPVPSRASSFSNANRTSVGCKSPLTGGIKEANGGGSFSYGLGQLKIAGFTLHWRLAELGGHPLQEGRHHRLRRRRAVPGQGQLRGPGPCCTRSTARRSPSRSAAPWASTRACSPASPSATRTAGPRGSPRAAAWAR